jgi:hypothetical protein
MKQTGAEAAALRARGIGMMLFFLGFILTMVTVYSGYRAKVTAMETGTGSASWITYLFSDDYHGDHRILLILGCYVAPLVGLLCFGLGARLALVRPKAP